MVAIVPRSWYAKGSDGRPARRRAIWRTTCSACWIATGARLGYGSPSGSSAPHMSPMTWASGCSGMRRSSSTTTLPSGAQLDPEGLGQRVGAYPCGPHDRASGDAGLVLQRHPAGVDLGQRRAGDDLDTASLEGGGGRSPAGGAGRRTGAAPRAVPRPGRPAPGHGPPRGTRRRWSWSTRSDTPPAISTPVGPPPTITKVRPRRYVAGSAAARRRGAARGPAGRRRGPAS